MVIINQDQWADTATALEVAVKNVLCRPVPNKVTAYAQREEWVHDYAERLKETSSTYLQIDDPDTVVGRLQILAGLLSNLLYWEW
jgi:hypothetical protein